MNVFRRRSDAMANKIVMIWVTRSIAVSLPFIYKIILRNFQSWSHEVDSVLVDKCNLLNYYLSSLLIKRGSVAPAWHATVNAWIANSYAMGCSTAPTDPMRTAAYVPTGQRRVNWSWNLMYPQKERYQIQKYLFDVFIIAVIQIHYSIGTHLFGHCFYLTFCLLYILRYFLLLIDFLCVNP